MIRRGEIYYVAFPRGRGSEQAGRRPAVIIQNDFGNEFASTTIIASMTSQRGRAYPFRVLVSRDESGLDGDSAVMLDQIYTVAIERLGPRAGQLGPGAMREVDRALHHSLGLFACPIARERSSE